MRAYNQIHSDLEDSRYLLKQIGSMSEEEASYEFGAASKDQAIDIIINEIVQLEKELEECEIDSRDANRFDDMYDRLKTA